MKIILNKKIITLSIFLVFLFFFSKITLAVWDGFPYDPGETNNPECLPSQTDCDVLPAVTTEVDPVFIASEAFTITGGDTTNWDTAYGWGNHASAGYLTTYTEADPIYSASSWFTTTNNSTNWDTAYGWGNHANGGYLTTITAGTTYIPYTGATTDIDLGTQDFVTTGTIGGGAITGTSLIKSGGTSSQFLKADGSTDSSTYLTTIPDNYLLNTGDTATGNYAFDTNTLFVNSTNHRVGIGTTAPSRLLHVNGNAQFGDPTVSTLTATPLNVSFGGTYGSNTAGSTGNLKWDMYTAGSSRYGIGMSVGLMEYQAGNNGGHGFFVDAGTRAMTILYTGKVGIGTAAPTAVLHLKAGTATANTAPLKFTSGTLNTTAGAGAVEFLTDDLFFTITTGAARKKIALLPTDASFALTAAKTFTVSNTLTLSGTDSSTLDIGTGGTLGTGAYATIANYLPLAGGTMTGGITNSTSVNPFTTLAESWIGPSSTAGIYFKDGNVGIGTTSPGYLLAMGTGGGFYNEATGAWTDGSDRNYKKDILDLNKYGLKTLKELHPVSYIMKHSGVEQIGFIAQEVKELIPELVSGEDGSMGLNYGGFAPLLVKGIQELDLKLEDLAIPIDENTNRTFAQRFFDKLIAWLGSSDNGLEKICIKKSNGTEFCVNGDQLEQAVNGLSTTNSSPSSSVPEVESTPNPVSELTPEPESEIIPESDTTLTSEPTPTETTIPEPTPTPEPEIIPESDTTPTPELIPTETTENEQIINQEEIQ